VSPSFESSHIFDIIPLASEIIAGLFVIYNYAFLMIAYERSAEGCKNLKIFIVLSK
jgi:hypothetical protein